MAWFSPPQPPRIQPMEQPKAPLSGAQKGGVAAALLAILAAVYANEGGFTDNPNDPGGATNYGITEKVARQNGYLGNMRDFPKHCSSFSITCADKIYIARYIEGPGYMPLVSIEPAVAEELVDTAVNMGPPRPSRWFQQNLNMLDDARIAEDGKVGKQTIAAYVHFQQRVGAKEACIVMLAQLDARQAAEYRRLAANTPAFRSFLKGWLAHRIGNVDRRKCGKGQT